MLAAGDELARTADADALTTTSVSKRSGVPVATIYRYFADRSAIISALIDRETAEIDDVIRARLAQLETVTLEALLHTISDAHREHFKASRRSIVMWFGARNSKEVLGRVERRYEYLGDWLIKGSVKSGMAVPDAPKFGAEYIVWTSDRAFEFMFRRERTAEDEQQIYELAMTLITRSINDFSTELGREGISQEKFQAAFGAYAPPSGS